MRVSVVWFKRDLRINDHAPLKAAIEAGHPLLAVTFLEPSLKRSDHYSARHWQFVSESVVNINESHRLNIHFLEMDIEKFFSLLSEECTIDAVYSYRETGLQVTYDRDKRISNLLASKGIRWKEFAYAGVIRGIRDRRSWRKSWYATMATPLDTPDIEHLIQAKLPGNLQAHLVQHSTNIKGFQQGGVTMAHETLDSFLKFRSRGYTRDISNPAASRESCSRLSPYLAWGNISMREVYQFAKSNGAPRPFMSRLRWHCHFIQKFESETRYASENINRGYDSIRNEINEDFLDAWEKGLTGFPLVDACMRAVKATGYLNFRMRAMLVSFLTHHLWQDWRTGVKFLGRQFLDFEPGIHYTQFQMQAGVTGINTIRIYNPVKQAMDHDREAAFISEWAPELAELPVQFRLEPWKMTNIEQQMYKVIVGKDYPSRMVDHQKTYRRASAELYRMKGDEMVKSEARRILALHTIPNRRV